VTTDAIAGGVAHDRQQTCVGQVIHRRGSGTAVQIQFHQERGNDVLVRWVPAGPNQDFQLLIGLDVIAEQAHDFRRDPIVRHDVIRRELIVTMAIITTAAKVAASTARSPVFPTAKVRHCRDGRSDTSKLEYRTMRTGLRGVVFSEADAAFDSANPSEWSTAARVVAELRQDGVAVVVCSLKTHAEVELIQHDLHCADPCIVERGSAAVVPDGHFPGGLMKVPAVGGFRTLEFGLRRDVVLATLYRTAALELVEIVGLRDLSLEQIALECRLPLHRARLISQRAYSEWFRLLNPADVAHDRLLRALRANRLTCTALDGLDGFWQVDSSPGFGSAIASLRRLYAGLPSIVHSSNAPDLRSWVGSLARIAADVGDTRATETLDPQLP
jgi:mannosyl-3-phosphoglycerate phosphatase